MQERIPEPKRIAQAHTQAEARVERRATGGRGVCQGFAAWY